MKITVNEARGYFRDASQHSHGLTEKDLPETGVEYWANGPVCAVFHPSFWPDVWMAHYAVKERGPALMQPAREIMQAFWDEKQPARLIGWTDSRNRLAVAFAKRLGFVEDGRMPLDGYEIIMQGWVK